MQANGHENIEKIIGSYLYQLINKKHHFNIGKSVDVVCKSEDEFINLLYLGNWVTDMSQLLVPDFFYEIRKKLNGKIDAYNARIDRIQPFLGEKFGDYFDSLFDDQFLNAFISALEQTLRSIPLSSPIIYPFKLGKYILIEDWKLDAKRTIEQLKQNRCTEFTNYLNKFKIDTTVVASYIGTNKKPFEYTDTSDPIWDIAQAIVKILGFKKYCIGPNKMSFENFETAISNFIVSQLPGYSDKTDPTFPLQTDPSF